MKRGDVWTVAGGSTYARKPRPVVIIQDDRFDATDSVTVCPLTSDATPAPLIRTLIRPSAENGLRSESFAMADKIITIPRARIRDRVGRLSESDLAAINRCVLVFLGLVG